MTRRIIYVILVAAALALPLEGTDIGKLKPVGLVQVYKDEGLVMIRTDTGDSGTGKTVAEAMADMKMTSTGIIFLDTADYLLISRDASEELPLIRKYLKPKIRLFEAEKTVNPSEAAQYLISHRPLKLLKKRVETDGTETLVTENKKIKIK